MTPGGRDLSSPLDRHQAPGRLGRHRRRRPLPAQPDPDHQDRHQALPRLDPGLRHRRPCRRVATWQLAGTQVQLYDDSGAIIGSLLLSGNRFLGTLAGGIAVSMAG